MNQAQTKMQTSYLVFSLFGLRLALASSAAQGVVELPQQLTPIGHNAAFTLAVFSRGGKRAYLIIDAQLVASMHHALAHEEREMRAVMTRHKDTDIGFYVQRSADLNVVRSARAPATAPLSTSTQSALELACLQTKQCNYFLIDNTFFTQYLGL